MYTHTKPFFTMTYVHIHMSWQRCVLVILTGKEDTMVQLETTVNKTESVKYNYHTHSMVIIRKGKQNIIHFKSWPLNIVMRFFIVYNKIRPKITILAIRIYIVCKMITH